MILLLLIIFLHMIYHFKFIIISFRMTFRLFRSLHLLHRPNNITCHARNIYLLHAAYKLSLFVCFFFGKSQNQPLIFLYKFIHISFSFLFTIHDLISLVYNSQVWFSIKKLLVLLLVLLVSLLLFGVI